MYRFPAHTSRPDANPTSKPQEPTVHILGLGSIGLFTAHCLAAICAKPPPKVTLLLHQPSLLKAYLKNKRRIIVESPEGEHINQDGYTVEVRDKEMWWSDAGNNQISNLGGDMDEVATRPIASKITDLILCVRATQTVEAIKSVRSRLTPRSNVLFLQSGLGMIEALNRHVFPDPAERPNYLLGVMSHGVSLRAPFKVKHDEASTTFIGVVPRESTQAGSKKKIVKQAEGSLLRTLKMSKRLNARSITYLSVLQMQLKKLAIDSFCHPICALNNTSNGFLLTLSPKILDLLASEISSVVLALPEFQSISGISESFSTESLAGAMTNATRKADTGTCSMVFDLRAGRQTEIEFTNGYWCRRGREVGVQTPANDQLVRLIWMKSQGPKKTNQRAAFNPEYLTVP